MNINYVKYVLEVVRQRSFTKAGDVLWITQQGVSRAVKEIETELGITLFERAGKNVSLTAEGRALLPYFEEIVSSYNALKTKAYTLKQQNRITVEKLLNVYTTPFFDIVIWGVLNKMLRSMGIEAISTRQVDLNGAIEQVYRKPQNAMAIVSVRSTKISDLNNKTSLCFSPLLKTDLITWVNSKLISPSKRSFSVNEIRNLPIAYFNDPDLTWTIKEEFGEKVLNNVVARSSNWNLLNELVAEGKAALLTDSFTTSFYTKKDSGSFAVPIRKPITFYVGFLYSSEAGLQKEYFGYMNLLRKCMDTLYGGCCSLE